METTIYCLAKVRLRSLLGKKILLIFKDGCGGFRQTHTCATITRVTSDGIEAKEWGYTHRHSLEEVVAGYDENEEEVFRVLETEKPLCLS